MSKEVLELALENELSASDFIDKAPQSWDKTERTEWARLQAMYHNMRVFKKSIRQAIAEDSMAMSIEAMKQALTTLEMTQDNLRPHGDNCFIHDEGEYNRCFCGKDSLENYLQEQVEDLSQAIAKAEKQDQDDPVYKFCDDGKVILKNPEILSQTFKVLTAPEGWTMVPNRPTKAMWDAWDTAPFNEDESVERNMAWSLMIAAA